MGLLYAAARASRTANAIKAVDMVISVRYMQGVLSVLYQTKSLLGRC
jgi:hypothetical protein